MLEPVPLNNPTRPVELMRTPTSAPGAVIRRTIAESASTTSIVPTSPAPATTAMSTVNPSLLPRSISTRNGSKLPDARRTTRAGWIGRSPT